MDIQKRIAENEERINVISAQIRQLKTTEQELLQELLRLDGEHRILLLLAKEVDNDVQD